MTTAVFTGAGGRLTGFTVRGHSGTADAGADLVCAAVTSAVRLAEAVVNDALGLGVPVEVREEAASIALRIPDGLDAADEAACQALLTGMLVYFVQLHEEHPEAVEVLEDDSDSAFPEGN